MKLPGNKPSEKNLSKQVQKKRRKTVREEIYKLWQEELEEKGFNKISRLKQGLLSVSILLLTGL